MSVIDIEKTKLRPTVWIRKSEEGGYELYVHTPGAETQWECFQTFDDLVDWIRNSPGVLLSAEELATEFLQLSFNGFEKGKPKNG